MASTRQLVSVIARQRVSIQALKTCQRSIHTSIVRLEADNKETAKKNFAEALTDKFINQVTRQGKIFHNTRDPTRVLQLNNLPSTTTTEDIYKLAREAFPQGDKSIIEVIFCRAWDFKLNGRLIILMATPEDAGRLFEYGNTRLIGGNIIKMKFLGNHHSDANSIMANKRQPELTSITDSTSFSGRAVIVSGLPRRTGHDQLLGFLRARNFFPVEGAQDNILPLKTRGAPVAKFLVKFDSESEAWRCVRTFHNTNFFLQATKQNYKLSLSVAY